MGGTGKAFFFVNYDETRRSGNLTRARTIFQPQSEAGVFSYNATTAGRADRAHGERAHAGRGRRILATPDPTVSALLAQIRAATATRGVVRPNGADPLTSLYLAQNNADRLERQPDRARGRERGQPARA